MLPLLKHKVAGSPCSKSFVPRSPRRKGCWYVLWPLNHNLATNAAKKNTFSQSGAFCSALSGHTCAMAILRHLSAQSFALPQIAGGVALGIGEGMETAGGAKSANMAPLDCRDFEPADFCGITHCDLRDGGPKCVGVFTDSACGRRARGFYYCNRYQLSDRAFYGSPIVASHLDRVGDCSPGGNRGNSHHPADLGAA